MATPINIVKNYYRLDNNKNRILEKYDSFELDLSSKDALFNIDETDDISLIFNFDNKEYEIEIEDAISGNMKPVVTGEEFDLNFWNEDKSFFPGYFDIYITEINNENRNRYFFAVHPKHTSIDNLFYLRNYVNDYYDGLSLDLEKKRKMKVSFDDDSQPLNIYSSYNYLISSFPSITHCINSYLKRRPEQLIKKDIVSSKFKSVSVKSVRWLLQKGYKRNKDLNKPEVLLTEKTHFTIDNDQNRIFKSYVVFWDNELKNIIDNLYNHQKKTNENIILLQNQLEDDKNEFEVISKIRNISNKVKKQLEGKIKDNSNRINSLKARSDEYSRRADNILRFKMFMENVRYNSWIKTIDVEENYNYAKLNNKELKLIKEYKDRYIGIKRKVSYGKQEKIDYFAEKSSPKLFETYLYVVLINILKDHGYEIDENLLPVGDLMYTLSTQSKIIFSDTEGNIVEIIYDKPLESSIEDFIESDFFSINSVHNRPDFIIAFKDQDGNVTKAIVIDAKWRKLDIIYNEHGDTDVMIILKDYLNLGYYDINSTKINRGIVTKVLAVYPDNNEYNQDALNGLITYCGLKICDTIETTKNFAYIDSVLFEST